MSLSTKKRAVLIKLEPTYNVDSLPTPANDGLLMAELTLTPLQTDVATRSFVRAGFGGFGEKVTTKYGKLEIKVEMAGFGVAGPASPTASYDALLQICGLAGTLTADTKWDYTPISSGVASATTYCYVDGRLHKFTGCRGNLKFEMKAKALPYYTFEVWGNYVDVVDAPIVSPVLTAFQEPLPVTLDNTSLAALLGDPTGVCLDSFSFDLGNSVLPPTARVNCANEIRITDRNSTGSITVEGTTVAVKDWWASVVAATPTETIDLTHGLLPGNRAQFASSRMQVKPVELGDQDNLEMLTLPVLFNPLVPGDEFTLTLK